MKYTALELQPMQESGASLLRAMQNETMPRLDLLVRESVQNALDASKQNHGGEVRVDYLVRTHATKTIASLFADGISADVLNTRFPGGGRMLEIRDSLTEGLTGPLTLDEIGPGNQHGNLLKLVFEVGRTRTDEGAGGSWGLGKTCYFRMGAGLVIYYSRIIQDDIFQERLVACLVEDENRSDRLQIKTRTGIAWWGAGGLRPITGSSQIREILGLLGIKPFQGDETGTSIIIPFLRDDLIPSAEATSEEGITAIRPEPWWCDTYESYITVAVQRWFCARLDNPLFATGPRLTVSVNGSPLCRSDMLPVFRAVQALYNRTVKAAPADDDYLVQSGVQIDSVISKSVELKNVFRPAGNAGQLVAVLLNAAQLGMHEPENHPDPYVCVFGRSEITPPFRPIVTFMRKPGMSVKWDDSTESRAWAGGLSGASDGRYLIALFVPAQDRLLNSDVRSSLGAPSATLESYLRSCERADHNKWSDFSGQTIISRIRTKCGKHLKEFGSAPAPALTVAPPMRMARNLADLLLPQRGVGTDGRSGGPTPGARRNPSRLGAGRGRASKAVPVLDVETIDYRTDGIYIRWTLEWGTADSSTPREIRVSVDSEMGSISAEEWLAEGLGAFPFTLVDARVEEEESGPACARPSMTIGEYGEIKLSSTGLALAGATVKGALRIIFAAPSARTLRPVISVELGEQTEVAE